MTRDVSSEEQRNRLLRRADWRFLLANPWPRKSVCFAGGLLRSAVGTVSECLVDEQSSLPGECDLAVGVNPNERTLRSAYSALRPGGWCYTEWSSPLSGGARGVRGRLQAAGFRDIACYWAWPIPALAPALYWLPLGAPEALSHFMQTRPPARGLLRRALQVFGRAVVLAVHRAAWMLPVCAIARKPECNTFSEGGRPKGQEPRITGGQAALDADWPQVIRAGWSEWGLGSAPEQFSSILLTGGHRATNKVVAFVYGAHKSEPGLVVKMPRRQESVAGLQKEATALEEVQSKQAGGMPGVPRLLFSYNCRGGFILGESPLAGSPLFTRLGSDNYREYSMKATDWLVRLAGQSRPRPRSSWWDRLVEPVLADFSESFGPVIDQQMLQETRKIVSRLPDLPLVCEQRDFSPWNIQVSGEGSLIVLDWESAELQGLPAMDLIYFLAYLGFFQDGAMKSGHYVETYHAMLEGRTASGKVMTECLATYADRVHIDPAALCPLRLLVWMLHSRSEYQRLLEETGARPGPETLRRSLFYRLWQEELAFVLKELE